MNIIGIPNFGNTCFFNASLQSLIYNDKLFEILHDHKDKKDFIKYFNLLQRICIQCEKIDQNQYILLIKNLYKELINTSQFSFRQQEDASDCIGFMIDYFHESIKYEVDMKLKNPNSQQIEKDSFESWNKYYKNCYSPIIKYFYGQFGSTLHCTNCKKNTNIFEPFNILTLHVTDENQTIDECLKSFCDIEELDDYKCDHCKERLKFYKHFEFFILPYFLFVRLKNVDAKNSRKTQVKLTGELDFTKYVYNNKEIKYRLYAIIYHSGSLNNGHYNMCRIFNNKYYLFDDTSVRQIKGIPSQNASILCYERV